MTKCDFIYRFFDIFFSLLATITLAPLLILIALLLRFTGENEVFYKQIRIGKFGKKIIVFKFATMFKNSSNMGTGTVTILNDPRVLPMGRLLRKTKLNELPQLFNVLLGDMSLVGPRPQTERCFNAFPKKYQNEITKVRPGLSGVGSIFFRNEEQMLTDADNAELLYDTIIMPYKGKLEEWFIENQSIKLYFIIIWVTLVSLFARRMSLQKTLFKDIPKPPKELEMYF